MVVIRLGLWKAVGYSQTSAHNTVGWSSPEWTAEEAIDLVQDLPSDIRLPWRPVEEHLFHCLTTDDPADVEAARAVLVEALCQERWLHGDDG